MSPPARGPSGVESYNGKARTTAKESTCSTQVQPLQCWEKEVQKFYGLKYKIVYWPYGGLHTLYADIKPL